MAEYRPPRDEDSERLKRSGFGKGRHGGYQQSVGRRHESAAVMRAERAVRGR